ncbi:hypothetical protein GRO01_11100 [Gluconobacter roseus NBRC 3990]|uniref:Uncharacterized protein n=1 Tax=Gluconobacter roseus NBRC 3990 TaxID=1307950 RepID=A0A4Y3M4I5_9PROT|nr:hypothetical protein AA3990_1886 [Gluconobacter roseus NBRC 3990]GEB03534.1 hypothetical protein GRO01_11100 [Gluconobacter roseus NBRC 3990]GLP93989.1 hypothetical protein GCM10007871_19670 [Gluconobacter roseus NBRC 3990]
MRRFRETAVGEQQTLFAIVLDRWMKDRETYASQAAISLDRATLNHFSRYLADVQDLAESPENLIGLGMLTRNASGRMFFTSFSAG